MLLISLLSRYGYEYQGTYQRVMCTTSTDKARLALFAACHAYNGAIMISKRVIINYEILPDQSPHMNIKLGYRNVIGMRLFILLFYQGQGKTESIKDVTRCMGEALYMFSLSSETSVKDITDICMGLASSGKTTG